jgi:uncharacterized membrane protein
MVQKPGIGFVLLASVLFSLSLMLFRILYTGELFFIFLVWNLFLAWIPYRISSLLMERVDFIENNRIFTVLAICWLLFIPNSFYIITDLFHLEPRYVVPLWYDLALILSFAWNGMLLGILSVRQLEKIMQAKFSIQSEWIFVFPVMILNAFGIYIGRYLRFNSWDVLTNPFNLVQEILYLVVHPVRNRFDWSMILCYAALITLIYITLKKTGKAMA